MRACVIGDAAQGGRVSAMSRLARHVLLEELTQDGIHRRSLLKRADTRATKEVRIHRDGQVRHVRMLTRNPCDTDPVDEHLEVKPVDQIDDAVLR